MGLGTAKRNGPEGVAAIEAAIEIGYRHLDTAQDYRSEAECGEAMRHSGLPREDFFVTTKVSTSNLGPGDVVPSLRRSAEELGIDVIDLALVHWPAKNGEYPLETYMPQMAEALSLGLVRQIGVSNFPIAYLERSEAIIGENLIANNQVEVHPFLQNRALVAHCRSRGIAVTCYMPIAGGRVASEPEICRIAEKHGATPEQVSLAYLMALDLIVIPSSADAGRLRANFGATGLTLDDDDMRAMAALDRGERLIVRDWGPVFD
ncbi:aldo/keto reductase [Arsenicitalea aurantiaca]|uniref:Aldo/keto reductase n=1 Tax=Arsenicitalea aurantiaca TaxID=1783274 RepID=A0A433X4B2_9HYPH|nr:aldo/keto reductase [Arsenicitalea aurantiaca]